jgi:hypothetical protein
MQIFIVILKFTRPTAPIREGVSHKWYPRMKLWDLWLAKQGSVSKRLMTNQSIVSYYHKQSSRQVGLLLKKSNVAIA